MIYKARAIKPKETGWHEVEASSPEEAAAMFHELVGPSCILLPVKTGKGGRETLSLCCVEVDGFGKMITRRFFAGIGRHGGVKPRIPSLAEAAEILGWEHDPNELIADGWPLEEEYKRS